MKPFPAFFSFRPNRLTATGLMLPLAALGQTPADAVIWPDAPVKSLGVVTINSGQPTSLPTQIPTTMEGITREQIGQTINATDSEDALKYLPSLLVRKRYVGDYNHAVLSSRASGTGNSARSAVYADGILLSNYLGNGVGGLSFPPRWGLVTPEEIERVDVMYGPFSAAYPGNSVGAVVDYVTRMPTKFEAHAAIGYVRQPFELYSTSSSYSARQASASLGNKSGDWSWWINANHTDSDGQPLTFPTRVGSTGTPGNAGAENCSLITIQLLLEWFEMSNYRINEFAKRIGRSVQTIRRWEREGKLIAKRLPSGHRYFDESDVRLLMGGAPDKKDIVVYCRVSSAGQKDDLASQVAAMQTYCLAGAIPVDQWIEEIGGGMNFKRKHFLSLIDRIQRGEIQKLLIAHKDRLMRFGFDLFSHIAIENGCEIVVVNHEAHSPQQEMVEDLMAIVHTFSCRLYGMRKYKQVIKEDFPDIKLPNATLELQ